MVSPSKKRTNEQTNGKDSEQNGLSTRQVISDRASGSPKKTGKAAEEPPPAKRERIEVKDAPKQVVEEGRIFFFYRPRVGYTDVSNLSEIQRFYLILSPGGEASKSPNRLIVIGKKRLPDTQKREKFFGFVEALDTDLKQLTESLGGRQYDTATSGTRQVEPCRSVGEGVYTIVERGPRATNLAYRLEVPKEPNAAQQELAIGKEGSYGLSIKNPERGDPRGVGLDNKADYSPKKQDKFQGYAWIGAVDPTLLDHQNCELLFIGETTDLQGELGKDVHDHLEAATTGDAQQAGEDDTKLIQKLRDELAAEKAGLVTKPAETGDLK